MEDFEKGDLPTRKWTLRVIIIYVVAFFTIALLTIMCPRPVEAQEIEGLAFSLRKDARWETAIDVGIYFESNTINHNALYLTYQPIDCGFGARVDYYIKVPTREAEVGLYNSISFGNGAVYKYNGLRNHFKFTMGTLLPIADYKNSHYDVVLGINYHIVNDKNASPNLDPIIFKPWSFELGINIKL